jgi:aminoglycoside phosphotransferase (APT) family kinase protein
MNLTNIIAQRENKTIYRDGDKSIKLMNAEYSAADVLNEALNLAIVQDTGFKVPALHEVTKIDGKWAIICDFIEGKTLWSLIEQDKDNAVNVGKHFERFAELQLEMHAHSSQSASRLRRHTDKMHAKISACGLEATTRYELHNRLNAMPKHKKLCHGDFTPGNVIITPNDEAYVIDWAHATQGNASADAARTYLRFMLLGLHEYAELYMNLFCKKSDTARQYVDKWLSIVAASQLVKNIPEERELLLNWTNVFEYE